MVRKTILLLTLTLAGCAAPVAPPENRNEAALRSAEAVYRRLDEQPLPVLRRYCMSAYWTGRDEKVEACLVEMAQRRPWLAAAGAERHARDLLARELHLRALRALDAGDYAEAIACAGELRAMERAKDDFKYEAVDALGILAVAHALAGDLSSAEKYRNELEAFGLGPFSGLHYERIWFARAYLALGDYARAYDEARRLSFGTDLLVERTAATYAPTGEADGYLFILHKSELETGRGEAAKAGFAEMLASRAPLSLQASRTSASSAKVVSAAATAAGSCMPPASMPNTLAPVTSAATTKIAMLATR